MSRVIQDSDDEEEVLVEPYAAEPAVDAAQIALEKVVTRVEEAAIGSELEQLPQQTPHARGTSSSEKLRREIDTAHTALWEPTPSIAASEKRRQWAADDSEINTSNAATTTPDHDRKRLKRTRTTGAILKTYSGKKDRQRGREKFDTLTEDAADGNIWDVPSSARSGNLPAESMDMVTPGEDHRENDLAPMPVSGAKPKRRRTTCRASQLSPEDQISRQPEGEISATGLSVEPSLGSIKLFRDFDDRSNPNSTVEDTFAQHNPNVMFPESSSTLASGVTPTQASSRTFVTEAANQADVAAKPDVEPPSVAASNEPQHMATEAAREIAAATVSSQTEGTLQYTAILAPLQKQDIVVSIVSPVKNVEHVQELTRKRRRMTPSDGQPEVDPTEETDMVDPVRDHVDGDDEDPVQRRTRNKRQKFEPNEVAQENADELAIDLPLEMYKPRPSRSRGIQLTNEKPLDLTISPTKGSKAKLRRRKTTGAISAYSSSLREMGFRSSQVEKALANAGGNFDDALEWLTARNDAEFGSQRGSVEPDLKLEKKLAVELQPIAEEEETHERDKAVELPERVKEVHTTKSKRGRPKKQQQAPAEEVEPVPPGFEDDEISKDAADLQAVEPVLATQKKSRGRPSRKSSKRVTEEDGQRVAEEQVATMDGTDHAAKVLSETDPNISKTTPTTDEPDLETPAKETALLATSNKAKADSSSTPSAKPSTTPEKPSSSKASKGHSPIKKDKVAYRVGLNRRMRIEPLLKIIRK